MSNYTEDEYDYDEVEVIDDGYEDEVEDTTPKGLRRAANKARQLERELYETHRRLAFYEAGIPMDDPRMTYFVRGYDGELSADAIRQAALDAGFVQPLPEDPTMQNAAYAQERVMQASTGAAWQDNSEEAALAQLQAAMEEGGVDAMLDVARQYGIPIATEM